jgi:hypothetical protein
VPGTQNVDTRQSQAHRFGRPNSGSAFFRGDFHFLCRSASMQVGSKFPGSGGSHHARHNFAADDKAADIAASGFLDELLHEDIRFQPAKSFDDRFGCLAIFGKNDSHTLCPLDDFYDQRCATHEVAGSAAYRANA